MTDLALVPELDRLFLAATKSNDLTLWRRYFDLRRCADERFGLTDQAA